MSKVRSSAWTWNIHSDISQIRPSIPNFMPPPSKNSRPRHCVYRRSVPLLSVRSSFINSYFAWRDVFSLSGRISMAFATYIHHVTELCWWRFPSSEVKGQGYDHTECCNSGGIHIDCVTSSLTCIYRVKRPEIWPRFWTQSGVEIKQHTDF